MHLCRRLESRPDGRRRHLRRIITEATRNASMRSWVSERREQLGPIYIVTRLQNLLCFRAEKQLAMSSPLLHGLSFALRLSLPITTCPWVRSSNYNAIQAPSVVSKCLMPWKISYWSEREEMPGHLTVNPPTPSNLNVVMYNGKISRPSTACAETPQWLGEGESDGPIPFGASYCVRSTEYSENNAMASHDV